MLYTFDEDLLEQVRGQLETNMRYVCGPTGSTPPEVQCSPGQCIHHFEGDCKNGGPECFCVDNPNGVQDCAVYSAISGKETLTPSLRHCQVA